jgi:hypothetical protein
MGEGDAGAGGGEVEAGAEVEVAAADLCQITFPHNDPPPEAGTPGGGVLASGQHSTKGTS